MSPAWTSLELRIHISDHLGSTTPASIRVNAIVSASFLTGLAASIITSLKIYSQCSGPFKIYVKSWQYSFSCLHGTMPKVNTMVGSSRPEVLGSMDHLVVMCSSHHPQPRAGLGGLPLPPPLILEMRVHSLRDPLWTWSPSSV